MITRIFTFGYGQTCQHTGEQLADKYATVIAPDASSARLLMVAAFGCNWAFEYDGPTDPMIADYLPGMREHARLSIGVAPLHAGAVVDGDETAVEPDRDGPWFKVGDRVVGRGWENGVYAKAGLNVVGMVVETKTITGSHPARQQFRAEGADWCGSGSMWNHSYSFELAATEPVSESR